MTIKYSKVENTIYQKTKKWPNWAKEILIFVSLSIAATLMVFSWIYHLKLAENQNVEIDYVKALLISFLFIIIEYLINTWITRYSARDNLFSPGQLAVISIVSGLFVTFLLSITMFKYKYSKKVIIKNVIGVILLCVSTGLLLWDKEFDYPKMFLGE
jgi:uncharacterized protein YacL